MTARGKFPARPQRAQLNSQVLRELQRALALTRCMRFAAEYAEDEALDVADALSGLLTLIERAAALLDQPEVSP